MAGNKGGIAFIYDHINDYGQLVVSRIADTVMRKALMRFSGTAVTLESGITLAAQALTATSAAMTGAITGASLAVTGALRSSSATSPIGYAVGAGAATVTQTTNRSTGVAVTTVTGSITTDTTSLAAEASAVFVVTATGLVTVNDVVVVSQRSGSNGGNTDITTYAVAADQFSIRVSNNNASAGTAETGAIIINYAIIKGQAS